MDKAALRKKHRDLRKTAGEAQLKALSQDILKQVMPLIQEAQVIGVYVSQPLEVDTRELIDICLRQGKTVCVPKIVGSKMIFVEIKSLDECEPRIMGILEPVSNQGYMGKIDCQIIPMLAFNVRGFRLGYGKGYYDAYLKDYKGTKIGLCFAFDIEDALFEEPHDVPCERIVTN